MKHTGLFKTFLDDVVNLNTKRLALLDGSVDAIKGFIRSSDWEPAVKGFLPQGSWAHRTIIKPIDNAPFDADLIVRVAPVDGWEAKDYINKLRAVFRASSTYKDKVSSFSHCVTITYAGDRKIDIAPLVIDRQGGTSEEVCNKSTNDFEDSAPKGYTDWFNERNGYSGKNSFRKVTRLVKYLRDIKRTFTCPSVLLTTLLGYRITYLDKNSAAFADTPTALQTVMARLDDLLQANESKPEVPNPSMDSENFADLWTDDQYANFRNFVHKYRGWIDEAIDETDFNESIKAWQRIFGDEFGKGVTTKLATSLTEATVSVRSLLNSAAAHSERLVEMVRDFGTSILPASFNRPPHLQDPTWSRATDASIGIYVTARFRPHKNASEERVVKPGEVLPAYGGLWFEARLWAGAPIPDGYRVQWRITNTGVAAITLRQGRGGFYAPTTDHRRWEELRYRGVHIAEAFLIRWSDDKIVGQSDPFHVVIL